MNQAQQHLTRRYLVWCYKTTKEELDRVERYFTQSPVDQFILEALEKDNLAGEMLPSIYEFSKYMETKTKKAKTQKYVDPEKEEIYPKHLYLMKRFEAIEKAIGHFLGEKALKEIEQSYEDECTRRIWEAREHT